MAYSYGDKYKVTQFDGTNTRTAKSQANSEIHDWERKNPYGEQGFTQPGTADPLPEADQQRLTQEKRNLYAAKEQQVSKAREDDKQAKIKDEQQNKAAEVASPPAETAPPPTEKANAKDVKAAETVPAKADATPQKAPTTSKDKTKGSWTKTASEFKLPEKGSNLPTKQSLPFMFETPDPDNSTVPWRMVLPFNPENYKMTYAPRVKMTMTQGGAFEDNIGISPPKFSITGVFGVVGTTLMGAAKSLEKESKSGMELYHEMEKNLLQFYERFGAYRLDNKEQLKKDEVDEKKLPTLNFFNFSDQEYWVVQIHSFVLERATQRRHLYQYNIQMNGLKRLGAPDFDVQKELDGTAAARKKTQDVIDAAKAKAAYDKMSGWDKFISKAQGLIKDVQGFVGSALKEFSKIQSEISKIQGVMEKISGPVADFANGLTALVQTPMELIRSTKATVDSVLTSLEKIGGLPHELVNDLRETKRLLMGYEQQPQLFGTPTTGINDTSISSMAGSGGTASWSNGNGSVSGITTDPITGVTGGAMGGSLAGETTTSSQPTYYTAPDGTVILIPAGTDPATVTYTAKDGSIQQVSTISTPQTDTQPPTYTNQEILTVPISLANGKALGVSMNPPEYTLLAPGQEIISQVAVAEATITDSDTVASIAQKYGVDWKSLVSLNGLEYPYFARSPIDTIAPALETAILDNAVPAGDIAFYSNIAAQPGEVLSYDNGRIIVVVAEAANGMITLENPLPEEIPLGAEISRHERKLAIMLPGDAISIPGNALNTGMITDNTKASFEIRLLGVDEELDATGAMRSSNGDISTKSGLSNLEMQLRHRIMTLRGELAELGHPEYGSLLPTFIGKINSEVWQARALLECQMCVLEDPRVASVQNVRFRVDNTAIYFEGDVYPVNYGNPVSIRLPLA